MWETATIHHMSDAQSDQEEGLEGGRVKQIDTFT